MKLSLKIIPLFGMCALLNSGCGSGRGISDQLMSFSKATSWKYDITGTLTLPASKGGGTISIGSGSTETITVRDGTVKDSNNIDCNIMERAFTLKLVDGRTVTANLRLLYTQDSTGLFIHGFNNTIDNTFDNSNSTFVPSTVVPQFQFLYLPNPASASRTVTYANPFGTAASGQYKMTLSNAANRVPVSVPAGTFSVREIELYEDFNSLRYTNTAFAPEFGIIEGTLTVTFPDGSLLNGLVTLTSSTK